MRHVILCCLLLALGGLRAFAQVDVVVRLDKERHLVGEPIVVFVDVRNVGDETVAYSSCDGSVALEVVGAERRTVPNILGCFLGMGIGPGFCGVSHPPLLQRDQTTTFRYLLTDYDLRAGEYRLSASGRAGVRRVRFTASAGAPGASGQSTHRDDAVAGAQFTRSLPLTIARASQRELQAALAPLVAAADGPDALERSYAREALVETAPPFLEALLARFAAEDQFGTSAIDALGRIATPGSRSHLKTFARGGRTTRQSAAALALARIGHPADAQFLASVLEDGRAGDATRGYAALGLGSMGGDHAVRLLESALPTTAGGVRSKVATALGNTRSRAAVPLLIAMFGEDATDNAVCNALNTLTHHRWCDAMASESAVTRRRWRRAWRAKSRTAVVYGPNDCPATAPTPRGTPAGAARPRQALTRSPRIESQQPAVPLPNSILTLKGYALGVDDLRTVRYRFIRDAAEYPGRLIQGGSTYNSDAFDDQYVRVIVPSELAPGVWFIVVEAGDYRSVPWKVEIGEKLLPPLNSVSPSRVHPTQWVWVDATAAGHDDDVRLVDARGRQWHLHASVDSLGFSVMLPDEVAEGEASLQLGRIENGAEVWSPPLTLDVTSAPLPLNPVAVALMTPVAPGQWTEFAWDEDSDFELKRADRVDVEFEQGDVKVASRAVGPTHGRVLVPARLKPGAVSVRTRTWIERTASGWSTPASLTLTESAVAPTVTAVWAAERPRQIWSSDSGPPHVDVHRGDVLVLKGFFPDANASALRVLLQSGDASLQLQARDVLGEVRIEVPSQVAAGDWRLVVGPRDGRTPALDITTLRLR